MKKHIKDFDFNFFKVPDFFLFRTTLPQNKQQVNLQDVSGVFRSAPVHCESKTNQTKVGIFLVLQPNQTKSLCEKTLKAPNLSLIPYT